MRTDWYFTAQKIDARLKLITPLQFSQRKLIDAIDYRTLPTPRLPDETLLKEIDAIPVPYNTYWGSWQTNFVMTSGYTLPPDWDMQSTTGLHLPLGDARDYFNAHPEVLVHVDGEPLAAADMRHDLIMLPPHLVDSEPHTLMLHGWTGLGGSLWGDERPQLYLQPCAVVQIHRPTRDFIAYSKAALQTINQLDEHHPLRSLLLAILDETFRLLGTHHLPDDPAKFYETVPDALDQLRTRIAEAGSASDVTVHSVGHAHLDTAWLWTIEQTRQKARRTFHTALHLMEYYPEYIFTQSQPQLYAFIREDDPPLFERIRQKIATGQWEAIGGMWVEPDMNLTGAESLVRQFLLGQRYFQANFGDASSDVVWLPDVFGFPASLPQIIRKAGFKYLFTIKPRWNEHNPIPYDTFWWEGIDGSRVLVHMSTIPESGQERMPATYNANATASDVLAGWRKVKDKANNRDILMSYGWGDGGGGPTMDMLDNIRVMADFPGLPSLQPSKAIDFFQHVEATYGDNLPVWRGELYLEQHQGTYTSQATVKRGNRYAEIALHDTEFLAVAAWLLDAEYDYPHETLKDVWQTVCLNQFHDILPGSSIAAVYEQTEKDYLRVQQVLARAREEALAYIGAHFSGQFFVNTVSVDHIYDEQNRQAFPLQPMSITARRAASAIHKDTREDVNLSSPSGTVSVYTIETELLSIQLDESGNLTRVFDKKHALELLPDGAIGNVFQLFEDRPLRFDAWNIDPSFSDRMWVAEPGMVTVKEGSNHQVILTVERRIMNSTITQQIRVNALDKHIDFHTVIDWQERNKLLKVAFPTTLVADRARYDIQWGQVSRTAHRNTRWDFAQYEVAAHHWGAIAEHNYVVALLSDSKYGYDIKDGTIRLTLLKSASYPDPNADTGTHAFTYRLHIADDISDTVATGYRYNHTPIVSEGTGTNYHFALVQADNHDVIIETVKKAEDVDALVVRLYDATGGHQRTTLTFGFPIQKAYLANLLERVEAPIDAGDLSRKTIRLKLTPFEVVTLIVYPKGRGDAVLPGN